MRARAVALLLTALLAAPTLAAPTPRSAPPQSVEEGAAALFAEADAMMRLGRSQQARERFEALIERYPASGYPTLSWRAAARVRLADLRWRAGATGLAGAGYTAVLDSEPRSVWTSRAMLGLAAVSLAERDWVAAADLLQRVIGAAEQTRSDGGPSAAEEARRRLTLLDRFRIRTRQGRSAWERAGAVVVRGLELDDPIAVAADADGQLLIVDEGIPAVVLVNAERTQANRLAYDDHGRPWWGTDGLPYLPTRRAGVIALGGSRIGFLANEDGRAVPLKDLQAGVRTGAGRWYLLDGDPRRVLRFGSEGDFQGLLTGRDQEPIDLAVDPLGRVYVLDRRSSTVIRFGLDGLRERVLLRGTWRRPEALEIDDLGNLYVLDRDGKTVDVYDDEGERIQRVGPALGGGVQLRDPRDIAVDGAGRLYIADRAAAAILVYR